MDRSAKFFRSFGGVLMILEFAAGFAPMLVLTQENYKDEVYSIYKLILNGFQNQEQVMLIIAVAVIPLLLALSMAIVSFAGSIRQIISCIGGLLVFIGNIAFVLVLPDLKGKLVETQSVERGIGVWILLGLGALVAVFSILGLVSTPKRKVMEEQQPVSLLDVPGQGQGAGMPGEAAGVAQEAGPGAAEVVESAADIPSTDADAGSVENYDSESPRGVMVGLEGLYQGAEIPFQANETLKLGRDQSNDLIFEHMKKVSRFHCALTWMPDIKKYRVIDRSTNGCFINGNEDCIPQNIAIDLEPGTIFAVGDQTNVFRLE